MISWLIPWWESDYVLRGFLHMHLSAFSCCLCPQFGYNWCPRVTRAFKWKQLAIIHIISSINTGRDTRKFISSPSYLLHTYIWMLNAIIRLLCFQFSLLMLFWFHISLVNRLDLCQVNNVYTYDFGGRLKNASQKRHLRLIMKWKWWCTLTYIHAFLHMCAGTCIRTRARTRTHTHTHTSFLS